MRPVIFLLTHLFIAVASTYLLQNPDFESPPLNIPSESASPFVLLNENNTIPGWTFEGTVQYVTSGPNISLPGNGHAIQLGLDGGDNCSTSANIIVSAPDRSSIFSLKQSYGKEAWESYASYLGSWGYKGELINLVLQSQPMEADLNMTCGPVVDALILKRIGTLIQENGT
ncbi:hypothetical protein HHK36_015822 [Tetracentron sinense]|uniref:DUF642 domain-containing protein n=1 Tax=Tetracentron sinense TaxID=13715 RepID=A0A834Z3T1_TETSI|nr:hypothetical protein HHK36_015822 [Tetracentron sinense]